MLRKEIKSILILFYSGGTKAQFATPYTKDELETRLNNDHDNGQEYHKIESIPQDESIVSEVAYPMLARKIMHVIIEPRPKNKSNLISLQ